MNILMSVNKAFVEPAKVMLQSLFQHNTWEKIFVYLLHNELDKNQIEEAERIAYKTGNALCAIRVNDDELADVPVAALSKETYYRLFAVQLLPQDIDKILYIDVDILVIGSLEELYRTDISGYYFAAAKDTSNGTEKGKKQLEIPDEYSYINAGVLLMNMTLLREHLDLKKALDFARVSPRRVPNCDQDVINGLFYDKIKIVSNQFNHEARYHSIEDILSYPWEYFRSVKRKKVKLIHYMGKSKPWKKEYEGKYGRLYFHYIKDRRMKEACRGNCRKNLYHAVQYLLRTGTF